MQITQKVVLIIAVLWMGTISLLLANLYLGYKKLFRDNALGDLGSVLSNSLKRLRKAEKEITQQNEYIDQVTKQLKRATQKVSIVRFNPFGDTGGDQSFALALLDAEDSGYILTGIHSRQGTRVYIKPIDLGKSKYNLSEEEQQALGQAQSKVAK